MSQPCLALGLLLAWIAPAAAADRGTIAGTLEPRPKGEVAVRAFDRESTPTDKTGRKYPGKYDPATGRFTIAELPLGRPLDVIIDADGGRLEGVDLSVPRSDYEEEQPLTDEDRGAIEAVVEMLNQFEDKIEVLDVRGNIQHAAVLVNKRRTKPFYNSKPGEIVWRAEVWRFQKPDETWIKSQDDLFLVLYRERIQADAYAKKAITFAPALGGIRLGAEKPHHDLGSVRPASAKPGIGVRIMPSRGGP